MTYLGGGSLFLSELLSTLSFLSDLLDLFGVILSSTVLLLVKNESNPSSAFRPEPASRPFSWGRAEGRLRWGPLGLDLAMWVSFVEESGKSPKESISIFSNKKNQKISSFVQFKINFNCNKN